MTSFYVDSLINSSLVNTFCQYTSNITYFFTEFVGLVALSESQHFLPTFENFHDFISFDEFQLKLLKGFIILLVCNLCLIFIFWKIYGRRICERFMKPATSKAIEELKASVSKLKLPKEHSPRI